MSERVLPVLQLANPLPLRGDVECILAHGYDARWFVEPCGGADPVPASRRSITRDIAYRPACKVDGPDAVIIVIGNVERTAAYG